MEIRKSIKLIVHEIVRYSKGVNSIEHLDNVKVTQEKEFDNSQQEKVSYPSAEFLSAECYKDYQRLQDAYDKIYDKVNIVLSIMIGMVAVLSTKGDAGIFNVVRHIYNSESKILYVSYLIIFLMFSIGIIYFIIGIINVIVLLKSKELKVFKSEDILNEELYKETTEVVATWLIQKYSQVCFELRPVIREKQEKLDNGIKNLIIATLLYITAMSLLKGVNFFGG